MSSVPGERRSLKPSSTMWFSWASSSICSGVSPARSCSSRGQDSYLGVVGVTGTIAVDGRWVDRGRVGAGGRVEVVGGAR